VELSFQDREALLRAKLILEHPGLAARIGDLLGRPIEAGLNSLPVRAQRVIGAATHAALQIALNAAVSTLPHRTRNEFSALHKIAGGIAGAAGGFFGLLALPAELPLSTLIILRAIAAVASKEGEDMQRMEARLACLEVLGLGSGGGQSRQSRHDAAAAETAYYTARIGLAQSMKTAAEYITQHGLATKSAPQIAELITRIAARFSMRVSEEVIAKAIPVVGAASGAAINALFIHHFQEIARAHFTVRRLERTYGSEPIQRVYEDMAWSEDSMGPGTGPEVSA
jgi:hypothetical protein